MTLETLALTLMGLTTDGFPLGFETGFDLTGTFTLFPGLKGSELFGSGDLLLTCNGREVGLEILLVDQDIDNLPKRRNGGLGSEVHFGAGRLDDEDTNRIAVPFVVIGKAVETAVILFAVAVSPMGNVCRAGFAADLEPGVLGFDSGATFDDLFEDGVDLPGGSGADRPVVTVLGLHRVAGAVGIGDVIEDTWGDGNPVVVEGTVSFEQLGKGDGHPVAVGLVGAVDFVSEEFGRLDAAMELPGEVDTTGSAETKGIQTVVKLLPGEAPGDL